MMERVMSALETSAGSFFHEDLEENDFEKAVHKQCSKHYNDFKDVILLDSGSSIGGTFMNPDLVTSIKMAKKPVMMTTNAEGRSLTSRVKWKALVRSTMTQR